MQSAGDITGIARPPQDTQVVLTTSSFSIIHSQDIYIHLTTKENTLKKTSTLSLLILTLCATSALAADGASFSGFSVGATAGVSHNHIDYDGYIAGKSSSDDSFASGLNAAYGFALSDSFVLSVGATYALSNAKFGQVSYVEDGSTVEVDGKIKDHWSIFIAPGYRFAPKWLGYAKLGYHAAKSHYSDSLMGSGTSSHHGVGYGAGLAYAVASNIEISMEIEHVDLNRKHFALSSGEPDITEFKLGASYRF